jgi:hypothetical protein
VDLLWAEHIKHIQKYLLFNWDTLTEAEALKKEYHEEWE